MEISLSYLRVKCPYCGFKNVLPKDVKEYGYSIAYCDLDDGGCDREFVCSINVKVTPHSYKIEGEQEWENNQK